MNDGHSPMPIDLLNGLMGAIIALLTLAPLVCVVTERSYDLETQAISVKINN